MDSQGGVGISQKAPTSLGSMACIVSNLEQHGCKIMDTVMKTRGRDMINARGNQQMSTKKLYLSSYLIWFASNLEYTFFTLVILIKINNHIL